MDKDVKKKWDEIFQNYKDAIIYFNSMNHALYQMQEIMRPYLRGKDTIYVSPDEMDYYITKILNLTSATELLWQFFAQMHALPTSRRSAYSRTRANRRLKFQKIFRKYRFLRLFENSKGELEVAAFQKDVS